MEYVETLEKAPLAKKAHFIAAWPLLLVLFGGAIGGALGCVAYILNLKIYKSQTLSKLQKVLANLLCGMSALSLWWFIATWVQSSVS